MRLVKARIQGYRSIKDTGYFEIEKMKTILVGPNESGKTVVLQALQKLNPPKGMSLFEPLRDYPRSEYDVDIRHNKVNPATFTVVEGHFELEEEEKKKMPEGFSDITYIYGRRLDNSSWHSLSGGAANPKCSEIDKDLKRIAFHMDDMYQHSQRAAVGGMLPGQALDGILNAVGPNGEIRVELAKRILDWMDSNFKYIDEDNAKEELRYDKIKSIIEVSLVRVKVLDMCAALMPKFILFSNYFRIKPAIHLKKLAERTEQNMLDDAQYDYGNNCLLNYLGFTAAELSRSGDTAQFNLNTEEGMRSYRDQLDERNYAINSATIRLTRAISEVWNPKNDKKDASKLRIVVDGQYLKVVVEDELGVDVELDQRSEGFQWLVSFFVVFFSEAHEKHKNAILLLDEPGRSLHALKQVEFQETISRLSQNNQTIFTTHSPFLVGGAEMDKVRVIQMTDRATGTKICTPMTATDGDALLPLQESLGYDLTKSLFSQKKNLMLESLTDYWYLEAMSELLRAAGKTGLDPEITLFPAGGATRIVYYVTILNAQKLKVAALLDSDGAGEGAIPQDTLVLLLGNKRIIRTKDIYTGKVSFAQLEDLIRETLLVIAKNELKWDVVYEVQQQMGRSIVEILSGFKDKEFSRAKLGKAFLAWTKTHGFSDLEEKEQKHCEAMIDRINKALR